MVHDSSVGIRSGKREEAPYVSTQVRLGVKIGWADTGENSKI